MPFYFPKERTLTQSLFWSTVFPDSIKIMILHLSSFVSTILRPNANSKGVHLRPDFLRERAQSISVVSEEQMKELENRCLNCLTSLRGLRLDRSHRVELSGFKFAGEEKVGEAKRVVTQPRPLPHELRNLR